MLSHTNIAFVWTEFQQSVLLALCLQEKIHINVVFLRNNLSLHPLLEQYTDKIIFLDDIPFSTRSITKFYREYEKKIFHELEGIKEYNVFGWSLNTPFTRYAINSSHCKAINLFEDGTESYGNWGLCNLSLGFKVFLTTCIIFMSTRILSERKKSLDMGLVKSWTLFDNAFPRLKIERKKISHDYFRRLISMSYDDDYPVQLEENGIIFLQSAYIESNLLNEKEYLDMHIDAVEKIKNKKRTSNIKIIWKVHPRTNIDKEMKRVEDIAKVTGVEIEIMKERMNIEFMVVSNLDKGIKYYSLGSTALYTIAALTSKVSDVFLIENSMLMQKFPLQRDLNKLFVSFGIEAI